jgi:serine/threonine-protein kinase
LQLKVVDRTYSNLPANAVTRQSPPAGEHMKISQDAHVVLSLGPQNVTIPALEGGSLRVARIQLLQSDLQLGEVTSYSVPEVLVDTVLLQSPPSGTRAASLRVNLLVSKEEPPPAYVMPRLVGMQLPEAERQVSAGGLKPAKITEAPAPQSTKGTVIGQTPGQGSKVSRGASIELQVAQ